ncbi:heme ABC exporter ATP-binding protein CcmA [Sinimarinibacterium sp. NLF-5-8]|uniref:heme ABC exporter ATP-binding protein CcmA n=1 Tax=Sinimarinibacterium sp. NLF-5-8 TaxID=2698684 RepID=UPI001EE48010|nr:heme ABC exporter ATP-binding protein CcmA [Sinimarinibacterium sp. NLF-5-8]
MLHVDQLSLSRGDRPLIVGFDLHVQPGQLIHLRGANGCGKTSLLETLAGLRRADSGSIETHPDPLPQHWIGHRNALAVQLSALENLEFWCGLNGIDRARAKPALARVALPAAAQRRAVRTLSAGQKRRSAIARLLLESRPLWLLDEPLDGLDVDGLALMSALLSEHLCAGGAVVMTSHQPLPQALPVRFVELADWRATA